MNEFEFICFLTITGAFYTESMSSHINLDANLRKESLPNIEIVQRLQYFVP